jgi:hypothetical protein
MRARQWPLIFCLFSVGLCAPQRKGFTAGSNAAVPYDGTGSNAIVGSLSLNIRGGSEAELRAGTRITLLPAISATKALQQRIIQRGDLGRSNPRLTACFRVVFADAKGRFAFHHLPAGNYFLFAVPRWRLPDEGATISASRVAYAYARLQTGETASVVLSP